MKSKIISILILATSITAVFILPLTGFGLATYALVSVLLTILTLLTVRTNRELFPTILFFALIHISKPLNDWFTETTGLYFLGAYYLFPMLVFTLLILTIPSIRKSISWWTRDTFDRISVGLIAGLSVISGAALIIWSLFFTDYISTFVENLPDVPLVWMMVNGILFALSNAAAEEFLSRGMLCNGLEKVVADKRFIIFIQATVFSIFHFYGFPGGLTGVAMVFAWSMILGIIRYRTKGLAGVLIAHFFADLTIYCILVGLF